MITYESTPNPQSLKFNLPGVYATRSANFESAEQARLQSPLALKVLGFPWAAGVFVGPTFVTITKQPWVEWQVLADPLSDLIKEHLDAGLPLLNAPTSSADDTEDADAATDSKDVRLIKKILREEIKPAVAMDGGDISFARFEEGRVYLKMKGSCAGCPSSMMTLKQGIETRLKAALPEVVLDVVAI
jgi:Fe-S cluster biogenesis protein NfuA